MRISEFCSSVYISWDIVKEGRKEIKKEIRKYQQEETKIAEVNTRRRRSLSYIQVN